VSSPGTGKQLRSESWKALEDLQKEGKVRSIGVSNYGIHHMKEVFEVGSIKPAINQIEVQYVKINPDWIREWKLALEPGVNGNLILSTRR
jgi:diketogulonate reductase-like aldo/keto reductase